MTKLVFIIVPYFVNQQFAKNKDTKLQIILLLYIKLTY
jgi:hypothetical protein